MKGLQTFYTELEKQLNAFPHINLNNKNNNKKKIVVFAGIF